MEAINFVYWLRGYFELNNCKDQSLTKEQVKIIEDHMKLVLTKKTPDYSNPFGPAVMPLTDCKDFIYTFNSPEKDITNKQAFTILPAHTC